MYKSYSNSSFFDNPENCLENAILKAESLLQKYPNKTAGFNL